MRRDFIFFFNAKAGQADKLSVVQSDKMSTWVQEQVKLAHRENLYVAMDLKMRVSVSPKLCEQWNDFINNQHSWRKKYKDKGGFQQDVM